MTLIARDGVCVVTREPYEACQAAHLVPQTRLDVRNLPYFLAWSLDRLLSRSLQVYEQIQGSADGRFDSTAGILLERNLLYAFDALKWSLYYKVNKATVYSLYAA